MKPVPNLFVPIKADSRPYHEDSDRGVLNDRILTNMENALKQELIFFQEDETIKIKAYWELLHEDDMPRIACWPSLPYQGCSAELIPLDIITKMWEPEGWDDELYIDEASMIKAMAITHLAGELYP